MAKAKGPTKTSAPRGRAQAEDDRVVIADGEPLDLRNRTLAALLAWLIPGAGHFYQQRYFKSAVFSISVFSTFMIGMLLASSRCVYASWNGTEKRWQYALQAGVGLPAMPAALQAWSIRNGNPPPLGSFMVAPRSATDLDNWNRETASGFDMGTLYTMIAGLLNLLVVFDAYAGPLPPPVPKKRQGTGDPDDDETDQPAAPKKSAGKG